MRKRIFASIITLTTLAVIVVSVVLSGIYYNDFATQVQDDLREWAQIYVQDNAESTTESLKKANVLAPRVTIISRDGGVIYDNSLTTLELENHLDREEVQEALATGEGESNRLSSTLGRRTYYYAMQLQDGSVLRVAKTIDNVWKNFADVLPIIVLIVILSVIFSYIVASKMAKKLVEPINNVKLDEELTVPYDELAPFVKTIADHRAQIKQGYAKLQQRNDTIKAITENMHEGVALLDEQGMILSLNKSAAALLEETGDTPSVNIVALLRDLTFIELMQEAVKGNSGEMTLEKEGKTYRILISPVSKIGIVVLFLDITERYHTEKMRQEFSANVSHELKTPLTSIYGNAEMLANGVVAEGDKEQFYEKIRSEAGRLMGLVEDIMMLSRLDEGKGTQQKEAVDLAAVATECTEALAEQIKAQQVEVSIKGNGTVQGSRIMMYELLHNLLDNGIKYNHPGGKVEVVIEQPPLETMITVSDTGIGIPEAQQARIFERFYRVDKSRSKKSGGTGLGLAIVKHVVLTHNGSIQLHSKEGEGTQFVLTFPTGTDI